MISILIPVYNTYVGDLVKDLSTQLVEQKLDAEIIVFDDYSHQIYKEKNRKISSLTKVEYKELDNNFGRVEIRKLLAASARFNWLLFIDGDSGIVNNHYLSNFYQAITSEPDVIQGGRCYSVVPPNQCDKRLHWKYGVERESITGMQKGRLHSNNFCIKKPLFNCLNFPIELIGYGHEDTWIGIQLEAMQIKINFIDNPVLHDGIESFGTFLEKTNNALCNLLKLSKFVDRYQLRKHVRIFNFYCYLQSLKFKPVVLFVYKVSRKLILKNLHSCKPSLLLFDLHRLGRMIEIDSQINKTYEK